jgi:PAS domain S-box-containing protein
MWIAGRTTVSRANLALALLTLAVVAALWGVTLERIRFERQQASGDAMHRNASLARAVEEHTIKTLSGVDQTLSIVKYEYSRHRARLDMRQLLSEVDLDTSLFSDIAVLDERGDRVTGSYAHEPVNLADRDYFSVHRTSAGAGLYIGRPTIGRLTAKWTLHMSRRIDKPDGSFGGVVLGAVNPEYFTGFYDETDLSKGGLVSLVGLDGFSRIRRAGGQDFESWDMRRSTLFAELAQRPHGSFEGAGRFDAIPRFYSYRTLSQYPLSVVVGTAVEEALAPFHQRERNYRAIAATLTALLLGLAGVGAYALARHRSRRAREEEARREGDRRAIADYEQLLERLATLAQELAAASDTHAVFESLLEFVLASTPCNGIFISRYDAEKQMRQCVYAWSEGREEDVEGLPLMPMTQSPHSRSVATGKVIITDDLESATDSLPHLDLGGDVDPRVPQSSIVVPMTVMGRVIGAMEVQSVQPAPYKDEHVTALRMAAHLAGMAVENAALLKEERSQRQQAQQSERRKAAVLESAMDAIMTVDHHGNVVEFNPSAERTFGYSRSEAIGRHFIDMVVPPWHRREERDALTGRIATGQGWLVDRRAEVPAMRKDGTEFPAEISVTQVLTHPPLFTAFVRDITERKLAEAALRESEERFKIVARATLDAVWDWDLRTDTLWWSEGMQKLFGIAPDSAPDSAPDILAWWSDRIHPEDRERVLQGIRVSIDAREESWQDQYRFQRGDGSYALVHDRGFVIRDAGGVPTHMVGGMTDLTEREKAEKARESLESQLRESQKMEAIGRLAGGVAHDFNNILGAILGNLELARHDSAKNPHTLECLDEIAKAGHRAKELVQQILSFSRRQPTARRRVDLPNIVEESVRLLRATLPARVQVKCSFDAGVPTVLADATQIGQVLINLGTNAAHAMDGRPGWIDIQIDAVDVHSGSLLHPLQPGSFARIRVADNGHGMSAETMQRVFEPFFTTKAIGEGTGLGLSVVHGIIRSHEGSITVRSEIGKGTTFELYLPAALGTAESDPATAPAPVAAPPVPGGHVVYIDDDESLVFLVKRLLERQGYRVSGYCNQRLALEAIAKRPEAFDLVVTDYNMPGMSGIDVASGVRAIRRDLPVALASGYITEELRGQAAEAGVRELIFKPNVVQEFCDVVARLVAESAISRGNDLAA